MKKTTELIKIETIVPGGTTSYTDNKDDRFIVLNITIRTTETFLFRKTKVYLNKSTYVCDKSELGFLLGNYTIMHNGIKLDKKFHRSVASFIESQLNTTNLISFELKE